MSCLSCLQDYEHGPNYLNFQDVSSLEASLVTCTDPVQ